MIQNDDRSKIFTFGKYIGFVTSMMIFITILFFVTGKIGWHSYEYWVFAAGFIVFYGLVRSVKRLFKSESSKVS